MELQFTLSIFFYFIFYPCVAALVEFFFNVFGKKNVPRGTRERVDRVNTQ